MTKIICNVRVKAKGDKREWDVLPSRNMTFKDEAEKIAVCRGLAAWHEGEVRWERRCSEQDSQPHCIASGHYIFEHHIPATNIIQP